MLDNILCTIICQEFDANVRRMQWEQHLNSRSMYGMEMTFKLYEDQLLFPTAQLLIFAESSYVGVYYRESLELDDYGPWKHLSRHDSCWRSDGVERFISLYKDRNAVLVGAECGIGWYSKREISKEESISLREVTNDFRNSGGSTCLR